MIRFHTKAFYEGPGEIDAWLNAFAATGAYVKVIGYVAVGGNTQLTVMLADRADSDRGAKKILTESQPEEFEEPSINIDADDESPDLSKGRFSGPGITITPGNIREVLKRGQDILDRKLFGDSDIPTP